jgi:hypothetical protein
MHIIRVMDTSTGKITWYKYNGEFYGTLEQAELACASNHPELLDDDMPDFFNSHIEEITSDKWNGFVTKANWADWHGEP